MAICDETTSIHEPDLRKSNEPQAETRIATQEEIEEIGFRKEEVHPFVLDKEGIIRRIFIDAAIYLQSLYFPRSTIQIPIYGLDEKKERFVEIGAFLSALRRFHGDNKVIFANITNGSKDSILLDGIRTIGCFTRFAPTPSNSLHIGNVRTALISYLFYRSNVNRNVFFLRFDDTDHTKTKDIMVAQIQDELKWLGFRIEGERIFESSGERQALYGEVMKLLRHCSYIKRHEEDGTEWLNFNDDDLKFGCWMDMEQGPKIIHHAPIAPRDPKKYTGTEVASLSLGKKRPSRGSWDLSAYEYQVLWRR